MFPLRRALYLDVVFILVQRDVSPFQRAGLAWDPDDTELGRTRLRSADVWVIVSRDAARGEIKTSDTCPGSTAVHPEPKSQDVLGRLAYTNLGQSITERGKQPMLP